MEEVLATMRGIARRAAPQEREELWRAYVGATEALVKYGELLYRLGTRHQVPAPTAYQLAADAAAAVYEYLLGAAQRAVTEGRSEEEAIADVLARLDERLLVVLAARVAIRRERGGCIGGEENE